MPARRFSYLTLSALKDILANKKTDSQLAAFFYKYGLLEIYRKLGIASKSKKIIEIFEYLSKGDEDKLSMLSEIVSEALKDVYWERLLEKNPELARGLAQDGFTLNEEGQLIPIVSYTMEPVKEEGLVETLLDKYEFTVAKNHLKQAYDNYLDGNWEAANGALRSFLQDVFDQIALTIAPKEAADKEAGGNRRKLLEEKGFIEDDTESRLVSGFFKFASYRGSHPGISNEADCRLRRYIAVALASYYLDKLGKFHVQNI